MSDKSKIKPQPGRYDPIPDPREGQQLIGDSPFKCRDPRNARKTNPRGNGEAYIDPNWSEHDA